MARKKGLSLYVVLFVLATAVLAGCASSPDAPDMALAANVKSALEADQSLKGFSIGIETRNGVVILTGWVGSRDDVARAGQIVGNVQGARSVENKLTVR